MSKSNISKRLVQGKPGTIHVGVDLALEQNVAVAISERGERLDRFSFTQDREGYDYFLQRLERLRQKHQAPEIVVAMEPTNYFWKLLATILEKEKLTYHLVNAYTVKKHREGDQLDRSKDDQRDAEQIAELSRNGKYTETQLQKGHYEDLRQEVVLHDQLQHTIAREKQVLWGLVGQVFPELSKVFKELSGELIEALLLTCAPAASIRQMTEEDFIAQVGANYAGKRFSAKKISRVYQLSATSVGVTEGLQAIQLAIQTHLANIHALQQQLAKVITAMTTSLMALPEAQYLLSLPALGPVSAAVILAEVGDPNRFHTAGQWVKLAGIQPAPNTSGKKQRSPTPMSHQGRPRLRSVLYFVCLRMIQLDVHFAKIYHDLQRRQDNPLTKMQALGVIMNKLLHVLWALIHNRTFYNPSFAQSI